jgi:hypothetical protein
VGARTPLPHAMVIKYLPVWKADACLLRTIDYACPSENERDVDLLS